MGIRHVQKCRTSLVLIVSPCPTHRMLFDLQYNGVLGRCCTIFIQRGSLINMILVCMARFDTHYTSYFRIILYRLSGMSSLSDLLSRQDTESRFNFDIS